MRVVGGGVNGEFRGKVKIKFLVYSFYNIMPCHTSFKLVPDNTGGKGEECCKL